MSEKNMWSSADEAKLLKLLSDNTSIDKIIKKLKKSEKDIRHKLKKLALKMCNEKKTTDEIKNNLKFLSDEQILKIFNHVNKKNINHAKDSENLTEFGIKKTKSKSKLIKKESLNYSNKIILMLTNINDKLDLIINSNNKNTNLPKKNNLQINNSSVSSTETSKNNNIQNNNFQNNNLQTKKNNKKSESLDSDSSGEDTDSIINMINKNKTDR